jgi:hypothetical protein
MFPPSWRRAGAFNWRRRNESALARIVIESSRRPIAMESQISNQECAVYYGQPKKTKNNF